MVVLQFCKPPRPQAKMVNSERSMLTIDAVSKLSSNSRTYCIRAAFLPAHSRRPAPYRLQKAQSARHSFVLAHLAWTIRHYVRHDQRRPWVVYIWKRFERPNCGLHAACLHNLGHLDDCRCGRGDPEIQKRRTDQTEEPSSWPSRADSSNEPPGLSNG
jgi:hypothetical protein